MTPLQLKEAIRMKTVRRFPFRLIAARLGLSPRTVRKHYRRWRRDRTYAPGLDKHTGRR